MKQLNIKQLLVIEGKSSTSGNPLEQPKFENSHEYKFLEDDIVRKTLTEMRVIKQQKEIEIMQ